MKKIALAAVLLSFSGFAQNNTSNYTTGLDLSIMDKNVSPKNDLIKFAAGKWYETATIPASEVAWGSFSVIKERNETNLKKILEEISLDKTAKPGTELKKLQDFYLSAMDSVQLNKDGMAPLKPYFAMIDAMKTKDDVFKMAAQLHKIGVSCLFGFSVDADMKNSKINRLYFSQGGTGLSSRDFYLSENYKMIQDEYRKHLNRSFELMRFYPESAAAYAGNVYSLEKQMAQASMSLVELRDVEKQYNKMSQADFKKLAPNFKLGTYFQTLGIKTADSIVITQPAFFKKLSNMMDSTSINEWKSYYKWSLVRSMSSYLSDDFVKEHFSFYGAILTGTKQMKPRWKSASLVVDASMGHALGKIFVAKHFNENAKKRVNTMVDNLIAAFKERIMTRPWMSESTKQAAISKLDKVYRKLGYPDKWEDYSKMDIKKGSYAANVMAANKWKTAEEIAKIGKPTTKEKWGMTPPTVNAYYNPSTNEITFPAGIMQPPFFDPNADDAFNYGIMGSVIGHELSHGFDDEGSQFDGDGNFVTWWAKDDVDKFKNLTDGLVNQFNNYVAVDTFHVNGKLTLGENIADLGGLTMAYYAYKKSLNGKPSDVRDGFTGEQRFFLAWAQGWKIKMRDAFEKQMVATNPHAPGYFRAIGPPSNMPEFYEAFGVKEGDAMYRAKNVRVEIW